MKQSAIRAVMPVNWYFKPVFGWPVVLAAFVGMFGNVGPLIYASFAFLVQQFESEFGWARSDVTLAISLLTFSSALVHPAYGRLVDRFGVKWTMIPSLILMGLVLMSVPLFMTQVWHLWAAFVAVAILGVANNTLPFIRLAATWFDKRRGLMIGIVASGTGLGLAILPKITATVVTTFGWQGGFVWYGLFIIFFTTLVMWLCVVDKPEDIGAKPDGAPVREGEPETDQRGMEGNDALKTRGFWTLALGILFASFALWGITNQMALLLGDRGMTPGNAALVATVTGLTMSVARLLIGYLLDRFFAPFVAATVFVLTALGFMLLATAGTSPGVYIAGALLGIGLGAEIELIGYMVSRYFGFRAFGTIYGSVFVGFLLGTSGGPYLYARAQELLGSYDPALWFMVGLMTVTAIMFGTMGRYDQYEDRFVGGAGTGPDPRLDPETPAVAAAQ